VVSSLPNLSSLKLDNNSLAEVIRGSCLFYHTIGCTVSAVLLFSLGKSESSLMLIVEFYQKFLTIILLTHNTK
jgi:hypothetical protein